MKTLPLFLKLEGRPALLVGGGEAAEAKARLLLAAGAKVTVVAEDFTPAFYDWAYEGLVTLQRRAFAETDLSEARLVIAATEDPEQDRLVANAAEAHGLPVNVVDRPALSSFIMPAIVDRGAVVAAISTGGTAPVLARRLRARLESLLPDRVGELAEFADSYRPAVRAALESGTERRRVWEDFFDGAVAEAFLAGEEGRARSIALERLNRRQKQPSEPGRVAIVGAGPGDPDLLTLRAFRLLQAADVVVYDKLVGPKILGLARRDAERVYVGKARGAHSHSQESINALLVKLAREDKRVVRLKGGDPFVFGRGGEEVEHLRGHNIDVELVPGITAATGCAAAAGFPLTHRDHASAVTFVSGQSKDGAAPDLDWNALARPGQTLVIYMGVATAANTAARLLEAGLPGDTPIAVIENGTLPQQRVLRGRLDGLGRLVKAQRVRPPALLVVGDVTALAAERPEERQTALRAAAE